MMEEYVTKAVHDEFAKRIDEENSRQNHRIQILETGQTQISELVASVKVLAVNIDTMSNELKRQGEKLSEVEGKPAKRWDTVIACIITVLVGFAINALLNGLLK